MWFATKQSCTSEMVQKLKRCNDVKRRGVGAMRLIEMEFLKRMLYIECFQINLWRLKHTGE